MPQPAVVTQSNHDAARHHHHHVVTVHVNERPVHLPKYHVTGLEIKDEAIRQHVPIQPDFILVEELGHDRTKPITDEDVVHVTHESRFLANDGDDNS